MLRNVTNKINQYCQYANLYKKNCTAYKNNTTGVNIKNVTNKTHHQHAKSGLEYLPAT